jgi:hypothetical protein
MVVKNIRWGQCVLRTILYAKDFAESSTDANIAEAHALAAKQRRETLPSYYLVILYSLIAH